ncbi:MAG: tRNA (N6-threonylcarbamoyladenosine(37)-N6)-methyltransferase TrmO [Thiolinea sp.]
MVTMQPIGFVHSCYKEKFGIPRQPGLVDAAKGVLKLSTDYANADAVRGLEEFSHIWLVFMFHATAEKGWKPTVRPPRLGGNARLGVFATRSMFRPNPLGLSVVKLENIRMEASGVELYLGGVDLLDGTPVLDIKPYLPYADKLEDATGGFAVSAPVDCLPVIFSPEALAQCVAKSSALQLDVQALITQTLTQDPRPSYRKGEAGERLYGVRLCDFDVRWLCRAGKIEVVELIDIC